jgi:Thermolysin metallopeptidase, catalytic domain/Thermolysin metallopeptidase, alpha-helical domain
VCARDGCFIVPPRVLRRLADDESIPAATRQAMRDCIAVEEAWRGLRNAQTEAIQISLLASGITTLQVAGVLASVPAITVYDCKNTRSLPGSPVSNPGRGTDVTAKRAFDSTRGVVDFYRQCFDRNSVDDAGMTLMSSIHYGVRYDNAFWNGAQMTYGDGDGQIFLDFTTADDVIGHELTHGVTQFSAGLDYSDEPGALNESVSDVFGAMFYQWRRKQTVAQADWISWAPWQPRRATRACATWLDPAPGTVYRRNRRITVTTFPRAIRTTTVASRITPSTSRRRQSVDERGNRPGKSGMRR